MSKKFKEDTKGKRIKIQINKQEHIKRKSFYIAKETINNNNKRQPIEWERGLAKHIPDKGLISKINKELMQLNSKKKRTTILKIGRISKQTFLQRRHTGGQQVHEKVLIADHQGNTNQKHSEISPHTYYNGYHQKHQ